MDKELALKIYRAIQHLEDPYIRVTIHDVMGMAKIPTNYSSNESMYALRIDNDHAIIARITDHTDEDGKLILRGRVECLNLKEFFKRGY